MNVNRVLEVRDREPLTSLRDFLAGWWEKYQLDAFLLPVELPDGSGVVPQVIEDPQSLESLDPFAPVMSSNAAIEAIRFIEEHRNGRIAIMLRPCELRAFIELKKRDRLPADSPRLVVFGVDCLGTFSAQDYRQMTQERSSGEVAGDVLRNAASGGLHPQEFRLACQMCDWPEPRGADVIIGTLGVASDRNLLLIARDEIVDQALGLGALSGGLASEYQVSHRETVVGALADMRAGMLRKRLEDMQSDCRFNDMACLLALIANCSLCGNCLKACPIYKGEFSDLFQSSEVKSIREAPLARLVEISHWLASCSGCGMCEAACDRQVPLVLVIAALSHRIRQEMHYTSGDPGSRLPWMLQKS